MRVTTYNCASVRARLPRLLDWLAENSPDVIGLQETKVINDLFPIEPFEELGYNVALHGQKSYNGVALLSKLPMTDVRLGLPETGLPDDARLISAEIGGIRIVNSYLPNGTRVGTEKWTYKLHWMESFRKHLDTLIHPSQPLLWIGDVNVAPGPLDVYESYNKIGGVGHHPEEFVRLANIVDWGLVDCHRHLRPEAPDEYTFWDFTIPNAAKRRLGWRIDHIYASAPLVPRLRALDIDVPARLLERPSDHTFVTATFDLSE